jgi:AAHS family 4-hydroxybenzoate transporter-like MFS transporter
MTQIMNKLDLSKIDEALDEMPLNRTHYTVFFFCFLLFFCYGYCLQALALVVPLLATEWKLPADAFGLALTAAVAGLGVMSVVAGSLGDRFGRRPFLILAALLIGLGCLGTALSKDVTSLALWRLLSGIGLGLSLPNGMALIADFVPTRRRVVAMTLLSGGVAIGTIAAGLLAPALIAAGGWKLLFIVGGILPLPLVAIMYFWLDESPRFLAKKHGYTPALRALLERMNIVVSDLGQAESTSQENAKTAPTTATMGRYLPLSIPYWIQCALTGTFMYGLMNWTPVLFLNSGASEADSLRSVAYLNAGGFAGGFILSMLLDRSKDRVLFVPAAAFAFAAAVYLGAGTLIATAGYSVTALFLGLALGTSFIAIGLASRIYPSEILATSIGLAAAIASLGGVAGPLAGSWIVAQGFPVGTSFGLLAVPAVVCVVAVLAVHFINKRFKR